MPQLVLVPTPASGETRVTFTSAEVGNGNPNDAGTQNNQDGGLAVRVQAEAEDGTLTGPITRYTDEDIVFITSDDSETNVGTFEVRDLVSGVSRGDQFASVQLGTQGNDILDSYYEDRSAYINGGQGDDDILGSTADDFLVGGAGDDILTGDLGDDSLLGGAGNDTAVLDVALDGSDTIDLGDGDDAVVVSRQTPGQVRLTFTSAEVGNDSAADGGTLANQDGGLAVRIQAENDAGELDGDVSRADDEGIVFFADEDVTFDVRDLVSGVQRGDQFTAAYLGTAADDEIVLDAESDTDPDGPTYVNAGQGNDTVVTGAGNDFLVGGAGSDVLVGGAGDDGFIGGAGDDSITGGTGNDTATLNVSTDGADTINLGAGNDRVVVNAAAAGQVRLSFTSAEVGNGNPNDSGTQAGQDGGPAVRLQAEDSAGELTGPISRTDDEGITFVAGTGVTFDVRDLVSGVQRGDQFRTATLGTSAAETITGTAEADYINAGAGNDLVRGLAGDDFLVGGGGNDTLEGGTGADGMLGGGGDDIYSVDDSRDRVIEAVDGGNDRIYATASYTLAAGQEIELLALLRSTGTADLDVKGNEFDQQLVGNAGDNTLEGRGGTDVMIGGAGDDIYSVDSSDDGVIEAVGGGNDRVYSTASYTLAAGQEVELLALLRATGNANLDIKGNEFDQRLVGNAGNNLLEGGAGDDVMVGGAGNDIYSIDSADDQIVEAVGGGNDRAYLTSSYTLAAGQEVELLALLRATGTAALNVTGNEFGQTLVGNAGANVLDGRGGADVLTGGRGADTFVFSTALGNGNVDRLTDFDSAADTIQLSEAIFAALSPGELDEDVFRDVGAGETVDADTRIVYDSRSGALSYDADGSGRGAAVQFATLDNRATLSAESFFVA
ncbi:hypothetical protein [Methylorubrum sp. SB2]|uniref:hypothetical protein n=1 Tax=Methylorubrum subtropicum TaxID=3138812 RepID=UPI00313B5B44